MLGCSDDGDGHGTRRAVFFTYQLRVRRYSFLRRFDVPVYSTGDPQLSTRMYGLLCFVIHVFAYTAVRVYHQSGHRDMYKRSRKVGIPENCRREIVTVIKYHLVMSNVVLAIPM